jgi:xylan 1,4-beta-xylosidase
MVIKATIKCISAGLCTMACVLLFVTGCGGQSSSGMTSSSGSSSSSSSASTSSSSTSSSSSASSSSGDPISSRLVVAVNAGGPALTFAGIDFDADKFFRSGSVNSTADPISATDQDALFQTERYGVYTYEIPVSAANYDLRLFFNELYHTSMGSRLFSVSVEGQTLFTDLDLFGEAGHDTAYERVVKNVRVEDGSLTIRLTASVDNGTLAGFAVFSDTGALQEPTFPSVRATNPNIWADVPDMSVIRVDDTYYMSSTTMHLNPGVPIMKSTNLKNWELINYAHRALDANNNALNMNGSNAYGKGTWASSISYKNGTYYVTSFSYTTNRTYIWKTDNIEGGQWTQSILPNLYHDASLILDDDGRNYLAYGSDEVRLVELNADATAIKSGGVNQQIIQSASAVAGTNFILKAEGTQIQKINGWYYVSNICWPSGGPRTQVVHRSRSITGPYEGRVVLQENVNGAGVAQGSYISTPDGNWFLYAFRDSGAVGRVPYLVPVTWQNDWPVASSVPATLNFDAEDRGVSGLIRADEFDSGSLDIVWQWNHNPESNGWSLTDRPGYLRLKNTRIDSNLHATRNTLTQRMFGPTSAGVVKLDVSGLKDGDTAGIAAFQDQYGFVAVTRASGRNYVVMVNNNGKDHTEVARVPLDQTTVYLRVQGSFRDQADAATFAYSLDGDSWTKIGNTLRMSYELTHFMGYRFALFNFARQAPGGYADFDYFHLHTE